LESMQLESSVSVQSEARAQFVSAKSASTIPTPRRRT
jgi:hypothetical protein